MFPGQSVFKMRPSRSGARILQVEPVPAPAAPIAKYDGNLEILSWTWTGARPFDWAITTRPFFPSSTDPIATVDGGVFQLGLSFAGLVYVIGRNNKGNPVTSPSNIVDTDY